MVLTFKLADDVVSSLKNILLSRGFVEFIPNHHRDNSVNFQWKTTRYSDDESRGKESDRCDNRNNNRRKRGTIGNDASSSSSSSSSSLSSAQLVYHSILSRRQKINHFQKTTGICKKDSLARNLRRMASTWGRIYTFAPLTYILPRELNEFKSEQFSSSSSSSSSNDRVWICKPSSSSQGKNIYLIKSVDELMFDCCTVVQRYIDKPMLIGGYKYDLRIYILVTSFCPLTVYMYREGLARFSSQCYDPTNITNLFSHLTNASINKTSPDLLTDKSVIGAGCKWTISRWFDYLESIAVNPHAIWERIKDIAILTLLPIVADVPVNNRSFELFGFDIMLDEEYKPWIIEVNASPAIAISGLQDTTVKIPLLNDLLDAIGFSSSDSLAAMSVDDNLLDASHPQFDPHAASRAISNAAASMHAAAIVNAANASATAAAMAANAAAGTSLPSSATASASSNVLNTANRIDKIQRLPRLVKMQSTKSRDTVAASASASSASSSRDARVSSSPPPPPLAPIDRRAHTRRAAGDSDSAIPRMPSAKVTKSPSPIRSGTIDASALGATPSKIPIRVRPVLSASPPPLPSPSSMPIKIRRASVISSSSALKPSDPSPSSSSSSSFHRSQSAQHVRRLSVGNIDPSPSTKNNNSSKSTTRTQSRRLSTNAGAPASRSVKSAAPSSSSSSSASSSDFGSICSSPLMIGDFELIYPFDVVTATASSSLADASSTLPLAVLHQQFAQSTVHALRARIRARDVLIAERANTIGGAAVKFPFVATTSVPSPWNSETIAKAVERAKQAARDERVRIGVSEPDSVAMKMREEDIMKDESIGLERAIAAKQIDSEEKQ